MGVFIKKIVHESSDSGRFGIEVLDKISWATGQTNLAVERFRTRLLIRYAWLALDLRLCARSSARASHATVTGNARHSISSIFTITCLPSAV
jgi:hypothetical protein